ncbi:MAG TPA: ABC transporter permease [Anaerolineales bacterium]|nr:ABC transporter permease [Anaerolineales bacterium]
MNFLPFILKRAARGWRLLLVVAAGVVISTGLLAAAPILVDAVVELGLPRVLAAATPAEANLRVFTYEVLGETDYRDIDEPIQARLQTSFAGYLDRIVLSIASHWMHPWPETGLLPDERVNFRYFEEIETHVVFLSGEWPGDRPAGTSPDGLPVYPVVIGEGMAEWYGLAAGDRLPLSFSSNTAAPDIEIVVAAVVRPDNPDSAYWQGLTSPLDSQANQRYDQQLSVIVPAERFHALLAELFPRSNAELAWHVILDLDSIHAADIPAVINRLSELPGLLGTTVTFESGLRDLMLDFYTRTRGIRTPLYLLTAEIVLLALVYVVMTAALSVRSLEREFAVMRSRGASRGQIFRIQLLEAALIGAAAWLAGPWLGALLVRFLGSFGPLADLARSGPPVGIPDAASTAALFGALAGIAGLLIPIGPALRRSIVEQGQRSGRETAPFWQRYYLDVMLLAGGLVLLFRFQYFSGFDAGGIDWLLLLSPLTLLLGAATLVIRIAPAALRGIARLAAAAPGLPVPLALWQTARNPGQFTGLVILLTLANALGILATGLNATLNASEIERARYAAGGEYRFVGERALSAAEFGAQPGVTLAAGAWRDTATVNLRNYRSFPTFELLAIDPLTFTRVTGYRSDFSDEPMGEILGRLLIEDLAPGLPLPGRPGEIGMWVYAAADGADPNMAAFDGDSDRDRLGYFAKLITGAGETLLVELTAPAPGPGAEHLPWVYYQAAVPEVAETDLPLALHSVWFRHRVRIENVLVVAGPLVIAVDDFLVIDRDTGEQTQIEGFEVPVEVIRHELRGIQEFPSLFTFSRTEPHSGGARANLILGYDRALSDIGIVFNVAGREDPILPAVVSEAFIAATDLAVGDPFEALIGGQVVQFRVVGVVRYFPTMFGTETAGFMITSGEGLLTRLANETARTFSYNEVFVVTDGPVDTAALASASRSKVLGIFDAEAIRRLIKADPMALGLRGVTSLGYFLTSLLAIAGFATYFYMSIRGRAREFGILRAMGMSPRQLYGSLAVEQSLIVLTGLVLGAVLGALLNELVLPGLPITLGDGLDLPPFLPRSDWRSVAQVFITLVIAFSAAFGLAAWALWRSRIHEAMRYE